MLRLLARLRRSDVVPQLWPSMILLCTLLIAAQWPWQFELAVGGDSSTRRRDDDLPFLSGVYAAEPADTPGAPWYEAEQSPYRWTAPRMTLRVPGVGSGAYSIALTVAANRPDGAPTTTIWSGDGWRATLDLPHGSQRRYQWLTTSTGTLQLTLESGTVARGTDPRELGVVLFDVRVKTLAGLALPDAGLIAQLMLVLIAVQLILASLALSSRTVLLSALFLVPPVLISYLAARSSLAQALPLLVIPLTATALILWSPAVHRRSLDARRALALTAAAITLRLVGLLHPHAIDSDVGFHANNLLRVTLGWIHLTAGLPSEAGGGLSPYPSGVYLLLAPLQLLLPADDAARRFALTVAIAVLDGSVPFILWWLLRQQRVPAPAGLLAATLMIAPTPLLEALTIGEYANVAGQALALPALVATVTLTAMAQVTRQQLAVWFLCLTAALLVHSGVTLSMGALLALLTLLLMVRERRIDTPAVRRLLIGAPAAALTAFLLFYSAPQLLALLGPRDGSLTAGATPLGTVLTDTLSALFGLQPPQQRGLRLPLGLAVPAVAVIVLPALRGRFTAIRLMLGASLAAAVISGLLLAVAGQSVRWAMFVSPWLAVGAALLFSQWWTQPRSRSAALGFILLMVADAGLSWFGFVRDYLH